ncbi:MAG: D-alanine--D-alanine ligase [Clostridia bacterium]|jgi:D-alanine-D-alanine ligase|nr:D-alanine--D-alanine ligase [Clostridia bacterium]MBT7122054.1 D-alanine--D-alanine ligase [Clostridia bacterium]
MNIVVLCGGLSLERDVSLCTASMVTRALLKKNHNAVMVDVIGDYDVPDCDYTRYIDTCRSRPEQIISVGKDAPDIKVLRREFERNANSGFGKNVLELCGAADIVFMALHGEDGEDGKIQAVLDMMGIKYTGAGYLASAVALNKHFAKMIFTASRIPTPKYTVISKSDYKKGSKKIMPPCVVKSSTSGSSIGVFIVKDGGTVALDAAKEKAFDLDDEIVVEEYIAGREFTCAVLGDAALPIVEIIPNEGFYDYEHKYQVGATLEICPAKIDEQTTQKIQETAMKVHKLLGMQVYSRTDFLMDDEGEIYCIEVNSLPGMTPTSLVPQEAAAAGISYEDLCERIIELSLNKYK